ncbi:MAG TPA: tetratricopeptide repeat protein [bacterium]|nr:tetratricopeptide repeat protein [bacterium]
MTKKSGLSFWGALFFCFGIAALCRADVSPVSFTLFGAYGQPVYPPVLSRAAADGLGLNALLEVNPTSYNSLGLGYEQITFFGPNATKFTVPLANFEARVFPMENEKKKFSPYAYCGLGLNLSSGAWQGPLQLKAGIGSRISIAGPVYFDLAVGSHWIQAPNDFQYVDVRYGLSISLQDKPSPTPTPAPPTMTPTPSPTATPQQAWTPQATPTIQETVTTIEIPSEPVTTLAQVKKYYRLGMNAFLAKNYALSLKLLKKSIAVKEIHGAAYYYAETYATIGVIYEFHAHKVKDHDQKALMYYRKALAIDPSTKSAKTYYKKLKARVTRETRLKKKGMRKLREKPAPSSGAEPAATPTPSEMTIDMSSAGSDSDNSKAKGASAGQATPTSQNAPEKSK